MTTKGGKSLAADLVIDTSGRRSKVDDWLRNGGYQPPRTLSINPNVGYQSVLFEAPREVRIGPWYSSVDVIDVRGQVRYCSRASAARQCVGAGMHAALLSLHGSAGGLSPVSCAHAEAGDCHALQVTDRLSWKFLYVRPQMPDTRGTLCMCIERGRWQVLRSAPPCFGLCMVL